MAAPAKSPRPRVGIPPLFGLFAVAAALREEEVLPHNFALLQHSTDSSVAAEGECVDAWEEYVRRLNHFNAQMKKWSADEAVQGWRNIVANMDGGEEEAWERFPLGYPVKPFGVETVDNDEEFKKFMHDLLEQGNFKQVAREWQSFESIYRVPESVAIFLVELVTKEWGRRTTWESAATAWDLYNDFSPGVAPYVVKVLKDLPDPKDYTDWSEFIAANTKTFTQAVQNMFADLRNYCLIEEPPVVEPVKEEVKAKPTQPDWTVEGPDGSFCPSGCDNCLEAKEKAKKGKVWCYTKKMPKQKPNARCNALLYSGSFEVAGNTYAYRYLCNP